MRSAIAVIVTVYFFGIFAQAFSIDNVKSIKCTDGTPTADVNIYFTTENTAARFYLRWRGTIPYDYGNSKTADHSRSGQFIVENNPDNPEGWIQLSDYGGVGNSNSSLTLIPTRSRLNYNGLLSGEITLNGKWTAIRAHPMNCQVTTF